MGEDEGMTVDEAEKIYMAWQAGFGVPKSKLAEALLILKSIEQEGASE